MSKATISHKGVVQSIANNIVKVSIINMSACSSCHAKGACSASDMQEKIIDANSGGRAYNVGDQVVLVGKESMGFKALFLGYLLPFLLVLITLIVGTSISLKESVAGLVALATLIPYYGGLYIFKDKIKKSFIFEIQ